MSLAASQPVRAIVLAAVLGAMALPAAAASVKVNVAGVDSKTANTGRLASIQNGR